MTGPLSRLALSELIGSIYDCALDPDRWDRALAELAAVFEARTAILALSDRRQNRILISRTVGIEPQQMAEVARYTPEINALVERLLEEHPSLDEPLLTSRHLTPSLVAESPYFQKCVVPYGIVDTMQYHLMHSPAHYSIFGVTHHASIGIFSDRDVELGGLLLPHLRRAVTISNVLDVRTIERARMAEALDALRCAVVLTNAQGAILYANRAAAGILRNRGPLGEARGVLRARVPEAARELRDAIGLAARDETGIGKSGLAIRLTGPEEAPAFAHVLPLTGSDFRTRLQPDAVAAVFVGDTPDAGDWARTLAAAFGLTAAETRLLARLLAGRSLAETAADLGIAASTARTHLDSIFVKTGATRQTELVLLAMRVAPPAGSADA